MQNQSIKITPLLNTLHLEKIDDSIYFSKKYSNYISNSRLSLINPEQDGSPEKFFSGFKSVYSPSFELGSAIHELTLQNSLFTLAPDLEKPSAKMGALADRLYKYYLDHKVPTFEEISKEAEVIDYYGGKLSDNKIQNVYDKCSNYWHNRERFEAQYVGDSEIIYLDSRSREIVSNCVLALKNNSKIQELLNPTGILENPISEMEQAILLDVLVEMPNGHKFILKLKAKLDNYTIDKENNIVTVNDVKTIGKIVSEMQGNIDRYHYNREFAVYAYLLCRCAEKFYNMDNFKVQGNYLIVSTIPQHYTKVITLNKSMYQEGFKEFQYLIRLVAEAVDTEYKDFGIWIND